LLRTVVLLAGLGAALITGGLTAVRSETIPDAYEIIWVEPHVQDVTPGQTYRLDGCLSVTAPGLMSVSLTVAWHAQQGGYGPELNRDDAAAIPWLLDEYQCLSVTADAPCAARSARYAVVVKGDTEAVSVDSSTLQFSADPQATPIACPTTPPSPTPTPTPTPIPAPSPAPTSAPPPPPTRPLSDDEAAARTAEPPVFPSLINGGFENVREDGTPYGWRKVGGEMSASKAFHAEGERSAALVSRTASTKWIYQPVKVEGGGFYRLRAAALKNHPGVREALLRVSWYESADGSGRQIGTADSPAAAEDSPGFAPLDTGPVQAPLEARSAKVRLLIRPASAAPAVVYFDAVRFGKTEAPAVTSAGGSGEAERPAGGRDLPTAQGNSAQAPQAGAAAPSFWSGPTTLANVRQKPEQVATPDAGSGRPLWPLLLALGVPAAALGTIAGHAGWRARLAGRNNRHL
jgi:hypothetical protein